MPQKLFYLHLPKTGGPTVNRYFQHCYGEARSVTHIEAVDIKQPNALSAYDFISGHEAESYVQHWQNLSGFARLTVLRDPVYKVLAHLEWAQEKNTPSHAEARTAFDLEYTQLFDDVALLDCNSPEMLAAFTRTQAPYRAMFDNQQTRFFLNTPHHGPLDYYDLKIALANMRQYDFVGTTRTLDAFLPCVARQLGFSAARPLPKDPKYPWPECYADNHCSAEIRAALVEWTKYDMILYQEAQKLCEQTMLQQALL